MLDNRPEIKRLGTADQLVSDQIVASLRQTYQTGGGRFFIYHDLNYPIYLKKALSNEKDFWVYYLWDRRTEKLMGFAILRRYEGSMFLNQIVIGSQYRGHNFSRYFLSGIIDSLVEKFGENAFKTFQLETFHSNLVARAIYGRWGMLPSVGKNWYNANSLNKTTKQNIQNSYLSLSHDAQRFLQLYSNDKRIGTLINNDRIRLNLESIEEARSPVSFLMKKFPLKDICIVADNILSLPLMDSSITYKQKLPYLRSILKNEKTPL
jgi:hypothetical protein